MIRSGSINKTLVLLSEKVCATVPDLANHADCVQTLIRDYLKANNIEETSAVAIMVTLTETLLITVARKGK